MLFHAHLHFMNPSQPTQPLPPPPYYDVFLSFAGEDRETIAEPLYAALEQRGHCVFIDKYSIVPGDNVKRVLTGAIKCSRLFVALITASYLGKMSGSPGAELAAAKRYLSQDRRLILLLPGAHANPAILHAIGPADTVGAQQQALCERIVHICSQLHGVARVISRPPTLAPSYHVLRTRQEWKVSGFLKDYFGPACITENDDTLTPKHPDTKQAHKNIKSASIVFVILTAATVGNTHLQRFIDYAAKYAKRVVPIFVASLSVDNTQHVPLYSWNNGIGKLRGFKLTDADTFNTFKIVMQKHFSA